MRAMACGCRLPRAPGARSGRRASRAAPWWLHCPAACHPRPPAQRAPPPRAHCTAGWPPPPCAAAAARRCSVSNRSTHQSTARLRTHPRAAAGIGAALLVRVRGARRRQARALLLVVVFLIRVVIDACAVQRAVHAAGSAVGAAHLQRGGAEDLLAHRGELRTRRRHGGQLGGRRQQLRAQTCTHQCHHAMPCQCAVRCAPRQPAAAPTGGPPPHAPCCRAAAGE